MRRGERISDRHFLRALEGGPLAGAQSQVRAWLLVKTQPLKNQCALPYLLSLDCVGQLQ